MKSVGGGGGVECWGGGGCLSVGGGGGGERQEKAGSAKSKQKTFLDSPAVQTSMYSYNLPVNRRIVLNESS